MTGWTPDRRDLRGGEGIAARERLLAARARYSRWDGTQELPDLDADDILDELADDVMAEGDIGAALRRLMDRGMRSGDPTRQDLSGLQDMIERIQRRREELLDRYKLGDVLGDIRRELDEIVAEERAGVERRLDEGSAPRESSPSDDAALRKMLRDMAGKRLDQLDALPPDVGGRVRGLQEYDFMEPGARERFDELVRKLQKQVLDQYVAGLSEAIQGITPEDLAANREMVRDLNQLLQEKLAGGEPDASDFLARHGRFFPGAQNLDDIIEQLAQRMAAMQSLLRSMTQEQRAELQDMMDALLRDDRLRWDLAQLAATMDQLVPGGLGDRFRFGGDEQLGLDGALEQIGRLQALDSLEDAMGDVDGPGDLARLDRGRVQDLLGDDAVRELEGLDELARQLERAGYLTRQGDRLELTPRGTRRSGRGKTGRIFRRCAVGPPLRQPSIGSSEAKQRPRPRLRTRVRRPLPPRPAPNAGERADQGGERAGPATGAPNAGPDAGARGLRGLPH